MLETLDSWFVRIGDWGLLALFVAAFSEYIFPPLPGDTVVLLGGVYAVRGQKNWALVFLAIVLGGALGSLVQYWVGTAISRKLWANPDGKTLGVRHVSVVPLAERMRKKGMPLVLFNRFLPGVRAFVFVAAGAARLPTARTLLLGMLSSSAWCLLLFTAGAWVGGNAQKLANLVGHYQKLALGVVIAAVIGILARRLAKRRGLEP